MAEAEGIPPTASVVVPGPSLNYVAEWAFAYSGQTSLSSAGPSTMLDFTTGEGVIVAVVQSGHDTTQMSGSQSLSTEIQFNEVIIYDHLTLYTSADTQTADLGSPINLIIPPFTRVQIIGATSDTGPIPTTYQLTGRVYDA